MPTSEQCSLKIHIWMNFPSHHQRDFFESIVNAGACLRVTYYQQVSNDRVALGWGHDFNLASWEAYLSDLGITPRERLIQLSDYIHIIPGYGSALTRKLILDACDLKIKWCHWSEAARGGVRWWLSYPVKKWYANIFNRHGLGAFSQGIMARLDFMRWGIDPSKIADLTYSVRAIPKDVVPEQRILDFAKGHPVFLFLGRLDHNKAIDVQIKAFARLPPNDWCLVFVGSNDPQQYLDLAKQLTISDRILFLPPVHWSKVSEIHQAADVLLLPSRYDGWGGVANEAAAHSKALILSTNCGAAWHLISPGINGFLVKPGSVDSLAHAMRLYIEGGRQLAQRHGVESKKICAAYTSDMSANRLIQALRSWLSDGSQ